MAAGSAKQQCRPSWATSDPYSEMAAPGGHGTATALASATPPAHHCRHDSRLPQPGQLHLSHTKALGIKAYDGQTLCPALSL